MSSGKWRMWEMWEIVGKLRSRFRKTGAFWEFLFEFPEKIRKLCLGSLRCTKTPTLYEFNLVQRHERTHQIYALQFFPHTKNHNKLQKIAGIDFPLGSIQTPLSSFRIHWRRRQPPGNADGRGVAGGARGGQGGVGGGAVGAWARDGQHVGQRRRAGSAVLCQPRVPRGHAARGEGETAWRGPAAKGWGSFVCTPLVS